MYSAVSSGVNKTDSFLTCHVLDLNLQREGIRFISLHLASNVIDLVIWMSALPVRFAGLLVACLFLMLSKNVPYFSEWVCRFSRGIGKDDCFRLYRSTRHDTKRN